MWCCQCDKHLSECTCPDLKERLERLAKSPHIHVPSVVDKPLIENQMKKQPKPEDQ